MKQLTIKKKITLWYTGIIAVVLGTILVLVLLFVDKVGISATEEEIIEAAKCANIHDFIMELPDQYDTFVGERGARLSGGQKQRISIARVFLKNPPILILDEATSSVDTRTELLTQRAMDQLTQKRTSFVIAHRLSTIRNSKAIMVLDHGRIIERGDHDDLIAQKGTYYQLYTGQSELS